MTDAALITAHCQGDPLAFRTLMERHRAALLGFLRPRVGQDAEELHQELWVRVARNLANYDKTERFRAVLFTAARRLVIDHRRRRSVRPALVFSGDQSAMDTRHRAPQRTDPIARAELAELIVDVEESLLTLPPQMAEVVKMRLTEDLTFAEIAAHQGVPLNTVLTRMHRGLKKLRAELTRRGSSPELV